jgi:hypothetical protein
MTAGPVPPFPGPWVPGEESWRAAAARDWELTELDGNGEDPLSGVPAGWRDEVPAAELADWYADQDAQPVICDPEAAWFAAGCPDADEPAGVSVFSAEEAGESLGPGRVLAELAEQAFGHGLGSLTDDALIGLVRASRRLAARQDGIELAAVAELDARRLAAAERPGSSRASEHVSEELALALVLTGRSADMLLCLARDLTRLPAVTAALLDGSIDRARAVIFAEELAALDADAARAIAAAVIGLAGSWTTGQLRARLRAMVLLADPGAARKRAQRARGDARVEAWQELSGNAALAGRELPAADMLAADARITAIARALQSAGAAGPLDQLRAAVFCALLLGREPETLMPAPATGKQPSSEPDGHAAPAADGSGAAGLGPAGTDAARTRAGTRAAATGMGAIAGSVHLTLPASVWLGLSDAPGELPGYGPVDAWTARDLAARLAAHAATRWHVTLTGTGGRAVAHACPHTPPPRGRSGPLAGTGPPGDTGPPSNTGPPDGSRSTAAGQAWLAGLEFAWLENAPCTHRRATTAYRAGNLLRECVAVRHRTCSFPGCRRSARRCDLDHTRPWDDGGLTCECNLAPLCRRHHRAKQAPGWQLTHPEPGTLVWTAPHGRSYNARPRAYPM